MKKLALYAAVGYGLYYFFGKGKAAYTAYNNLSSWRTKPEGGNFPIYHGC